MGPHAQDYPLQYLSASALAAAINYPLWRTSAIGQSGFAVSSLSVGGVAVPRPLTPYVYGFLPPYKGMGATVLGMTWARAAIFWSSDYGREVMIRAGHSEAAATLVPPLLVSTVVQIVNQPIVRSTVTLQDPHYNLPNVLASIRQIYSTHGVAGLWHGTTAGVLKTVPKYCTAIAVKDYVEAHVLPPVDPTSPTRDSDALWRSALKSGAAGVAGAALTNPLDVLRNEMFKTNHGMLRTIRDLRAALGFWGACGRGLGKNMLAVALPVGCTIFFTDVFIQLSSSSSESS